MSKVLSVMYEPSRREVVRLCVSLPQHSTRVYGSWDSIMLSIILSFLFGLIDVTWRGDTWGREEGREGKSVTEGGNADRRVWKERKSGIRY